MSDGNGHIHLTLGAGIDRPQGTSCVLETGAAPARALVAKLQGLPRDEEVWWSMHEWRGHYRTKKNWRASWGALADVDYCVPGKMHADLPAEVAGKLGDLIKAGRFPGNFAHRTPHGFRIGGLFTAPVTDRALARRALRGYAMIVGGVLDDEGLLGRFVGEAAKRQCVQEGFDVDACSWDLARVFYGPQAKVNGVQRAASVVPMSEDLLVADALLVSAADEELEAEEETGADDGKKESPKGGQTNRDARSPGFADAVARWNSDNRRDWGASGKGTCPACGHHDCFGSQGEAHERWACFSTNHIDVGIREGSCHHGDALDLAAFERKKTRAEILREDHYLSNRFGDPNTQQLEFNEGDLVIALDRGNRGFVVGIEGDAVHVWFRNPDSGAEWTRPFAAHEIKLLAKRAQQTASSRAPEILSLEKALALPVPPYIVKKLLRQAQVMLLFGASWKGKSWVVADIACHIAAGRPWMGQRVRRGKVLILIGEGFFGFLGRIQAWKASHPELAAAIAANILVTSEPFPIAEAETLEAFSMRAREHKPAVVFIDTLGNHFGGLDENKAGDANLFMDGASRMARELNAGVCVVHHATKSDEETERGSSAFFARADSVAHVGRTDDVITLAHRKSKDGITLPDHCFRLEPVPLGVDEDGEPIGSAVLVYQGDPETVRARESYEPDYRKIEQVLYEARGRGLSGRAIARAAGISTRSCDRRLVELVAVERVVRRPGTRACDFLHYHPDFAPPKGGA